MSKALAYSIYMTITNPINSESMIRKEMDLDMDVINCSLYVRKSLLILLLHFLTSCSTSSDEEVLHDPFENGKKKLLFGKYEA